MAPSPLRAALALALLVVAGCGSHVEVSVNAPIVDPAAAIPYSGDPELQPGGPLAPELDNVWPNQDQMSWGYAQTVDDIGPSQPQLYPSPEDVPPITLNGAAAMLASPVAGVRIQNGSFHLRFNGTRTTQSGAFGQNLEESTIVNGKTPFVPASWSDRFRARLAVARPDLRGRLGHVDALTGFAVTPQFLFGYVWELTDEHIGTYGDLDLNLAWKYLEANLDPGHEFAHQLVPLLADDVFLYARMLPRTTVATPYGTFGKCVRVLYVIDYGVTAQTDFGGNVIGYLRHVDYGILAYAAGHGPVALHERQLGAVGSPPNLGLYEVRLGLTERGFPTARRLPIARF
jgi:hypothetical protein